MLNHDWLFWIPKFFWVDLVTDINDVEQKDHTFFLMGLVYQLDTSSLERLIVLAPDVLLL